MAAPSDPGLEQAALASTTGPMAERVRQTLAALRAGGQFVRPNPDQLDRFEATDGAAIIQGEIGNVLGCVISGGTVVEAADPDIPLATLLSLDVSYAMQLVDGVWLVSDLQVLQEFKGQAGCA